MQRVILTILALICSSSAALITIWIVVPALNSAVWLVSVGASEWSLWFGALGLLGAALGLAALRAGSHWSNWLAIGLGLLGVACALVPPLTAGPAARANGVRLSLRRYIVGADPAAAGAPQTLTYATIDGQPLQLDAYLPDGTSAAPRPAIVVVHGGSWSGGDKSDFPQWNRWLNQQGYAVFDIQYRLAPQPNWQTATGDVKCAVGWVKQNAARFNVDPARLALLGRSAGGHLALLAAYTPNVAALPPSCAVADTSVSAVISFYGPTDLAWGYTHPANQRVNDGPAALRRFLGGDPQSAAAAYATASPINHVQSSTPPTLLIHGGRDQLVRQAQSEQLAERLRTAGVQGRLIEIPYAQHGFDYNFNGWGSQIAQPILSDFLQTYLAADARTRRSQARTPAIGR